MRSPVRCRCRPGRRACPGVILIARHARHSEVEWRCSECEFNGIITHWEGSTWDHSERPVQDVEVVPMDLPRNRIPSSLVGRWRIEEMEVWGKDAIDLMGPAYIEFDKHGGSLRFIAIEGGLDCRYGVTDGRASVEFSWSGVDDRDWRMRAWLGTPRGERLARRPDLHPLRRRLVFHRAPVRLVSGAERSAQAPGPVTVTAPATAPPGVAPPARGRRVKQRGRLGWQPAPGSSKSVRPVRAVNSPVGSNHLNYQGKAANRSRGQGGLQECLGSAYLLF